MKTTVLAVVGLVLVCQGQVSAQETMDINELLLRGDVYVHPESHEPYSGPVESWWARGIPRERGTLEDGVWDGVHEWYHPNGGLSTREHYENGQLNGPSESYFKSGRLSLKEVYGNGQLHGPYEAYWHRGTLAESGAWRGGEPCGNWLSFGRTVIYPACPAFNN